MSPATDRLARRSAARTLTALALGVVIPFIASATMVQPLHAQSAPTCGWHMLDEPSAPPTLERLLTRSDALSERHREAIGELRDWISSCDHTAARRASMSLRNERRRTNSTDPFLRALLAFTLVRGPDVHVMRAEGALLRPVNRHTNAEIEGVRLLSAVVEETGWPEAVTELAAVAVATAKSESLEAAAESLDALPDSVRDASYWMAVGEVELARGNHAEALAAGMKAGGAPRASRIIGIARMLSEADASAGAAEYMAGLANASGEALHRYFDDLRLLLDPREIEDWNRLEGGHAAWIARKWEWRAMLSGIHLADRLAENQRRLVIALDRYRRTSYRGAPVQTAVWTDSTMPEPLLLDDRGMIYLRHGEPTEELHMGGSQRLAWTYARPGPIQPVYEFDRGPDRADYFLAEPYPICAGRHVNDGRRIGGDGGIGYGYPAAGHMLDWGMRLSAFDPSLGRYYTNCHRGPEVAQLNYTHLMYESRVRGAQMFDSENAVPRLRHPLTASMNLYAFSAPAGETELVAYIGVQAGELSPAAPRAPLSYSFRILLSAGDPYTEAVARQDTLIAFTRPTPLPADAMVGTAVPLRFTGAFDTRITLSVINGYEPQQGQVLATSRHIPPFPATALTLSDIVIAEPRDGMWLRGASRLAPAQGHALLEGSPFRVYYELYNATPGDPLDVRIVVAPGRDDGMLARLSSLIASRNALSVEFEEEVVTDPDGVVRTDREIVSELQPGSYAVMIAVTNRRTGEVARREANLVIVGR